MTGPVSQAPALASRFRKTVSRFGVFPVACLVPKAALASTNGLVSTECYHDIANRFGISRTHVRNLVADGEALGLMRPVARGGAAVEVTPQLMRAHDLYIADCMVLIEKTCAHAHAALMAQGRN